MGSLVSGALNKNKQPDWLPSACHYKLGFNSDYSSELLCLVLFEMNAVFSVFWLGFFCLFLPLLILTPDLLGHDDSAVQKGDALYM